MTKTTSLQRCTLLGAIGVVLWFHASHGQATTEAQLDFIRQIMEERADAVLERYLPRNEFKAEVTLTPSKSQPAEIPYLRSQLEKEYFKSKSRRDLLGYVESATLTLSISSEINEVSRKTLTDLVSTTLGLRLPSPDSIQVKTLNLSGSVRPSEKTEQLNKAEQDLRVARQQATELERNRGDLKQELTAAQSEIARLSQGLNQKSAELVAAVESRKSDATQKTLTILENLKAYVPHFVIAGAFVLALFLFVYAFASSGRKVGSSISEVAQSLEEVGRATVTAAQERQANASTRGSEDTSSAKQLQQQIPSSSVSLESQQNRLDNLRSQVAGLLSPTSESIFVRWLSSMIAQPQQVSRAVVTMELLGQAKANEVFKKLSVNDQDVILTFMKSGSYPRPKSEMMIEAGEELVTRLMADTLMGSRMALNPQISERLVQLSISEIATVIGGLRPECYARLMLYLDTAAITDLIKHLRNQKAESYSVVVQTLVKIPGAERDTNSDNDIITVMDRELARLKNDSHRAYLKFYQDLLEHSDDEQIEDIMRSIEAEQPRIAEVLRRKVISLNTLFRIPEAAQAEILSSLSNRDLAGLLVGLSDTERQAVTARISTRRQSLVNDELENLRGGDAAAARTTHRKVKNAVVQKMRSMGDEVQVEMPIDSGRSAA